ncbi:MAG: MFS transporter [Pseudomonadota bacterium]|nr:MFS transporter [Pseudomonadota bacterium]
MLQKDTVKKLIPIMFAFFAMGAVDFVGIATNYVKADFSLSDTLANLFTSMTFFWFLIFSVPTGLLMNKLGRRKTVLLSLGISLLALVLPILQYSLPVIMISFSLLGIGNTIMQVSLNPLISNIVAKDKMSSALTFGQFVKAIASFTAPILAGWGVILFGKWQILFPFFLAETALAYILLSREKIKETAPDSVSGFKECFALLKNSTILLCFGAIMCHVGIDVGTNVTTPKLLMQKLGWTLEQAGYATSIYFFFRTIGSFSGAYILAKYSNHKFFLGSVLLMSAAFVGIFFFNSKELLYICIACIGYGNANIFPMAFSQAIKTLPNRGNEVSGLMVMGIFGGTVFPLLMGIVSDFATNQHGAVAVMILCAAYLLIINRKIRD